MATSRLNVAMPLGRSTLPREILLIILQELGDQKRFGTMFNCVLVDRGFAALALPILYSIHELSAAGVSEPTLSDAIASVGLWRSIISSSLGRTFAPYCLHIKALQLSKLHTLLEDLASERLKKGRTLLFSPPLEGFEIWREPGRVTRRQRPSQMDIEAIVIKVANHITDFIKNLSAKQDKAVALASLEGSHLPRDQLPGWVSSLSKLTTLSIRDGSVLNADVGRAIRDNCPAFKEVVCYYCKGGDVDQDVASFLKELKPQTIESFTITSMNDIGEHTFKALREHSTSLKTLILLSLERSAFASLNELGNCRAIGTLQLEANTTAQHFEWKLQVHAVFLEVAAWLQNCTWLRTLELTKIPNATSLLGKILPSPNLCLKTLQLKLIEDSDGGFPGALGNQTQLERLRLVRHSNLDTVEIDHPWHIELVDSICQCVELCELVLDEYLCLADLQKMQHSLSNLEDVTFDGEATDEFLPVLASLSHLKTLTVNQNAGQGASASFSFDSLMAFIQAMEADPNATHSGIQITINNQIREDFVGSEYTWDRFLERHQQLEEEVERRFFGNIEINYYHPEEIHDEDFSD